jgi:hypothetical protein
VNEWGNRTKGEEKTYRAMAREGFEERHLRGESQE